MKKIFSFLCALAIVLSASAAPMNLRPSGKKQLTKETVVNHVRKAAPKAPAQLNGEVINIEANNLAVDVSYLDLYLEYLGYGLFWVDGSNDEWAVSATLYTEDENIYTTFSSEAESIELSVTDAENDSRALTISAAELKQTAKGNQFTATGVDSLGNTFNINLTLFAPDEPKATLSISFASCEISDYTSTYGFYFISAEEGDTAVQVALYAAPEAGSFTTGDFDTDYSGIFVNDGEDWNALAESFFTISGTIEETATGKEIAVEFFATDSILYKVNLTYTKPVAEKTEQVNLEGATFDDYRDYDGSYQVIAAPADSSIVFSLNPYSEELNASLTVADLDGAYSWLKIVDEEGNKTYFSFAEGEFTTSYDEATGILTLEGWLLASNNVKYEFVIKTVSLAEGIENVVLTEKAQKVSVDGHLFIIRDGKMFNAQGAQVR